MIILGSFLRDNVILSDSEICTSEKAKIAAKTINNGDAIMDRKTDSQKDGYLL